MDLRAGLIGANAQLDCGDYSLADLFVYVQVGGTYKSDVCSVVVQSKKAAKNGFKIMVGHSGNTRYDARDIPDEEWSNVTYLEVVMTFTHGSLRGDIVMGLHREYTLKITGKIEDHEPDSEVHNEVYRALIDVFIQQVITIAPCKVLKYACHNYTASCHTGRGVSNNLLETLFSNEMFETVKYPDHEHPPYNTTWVRLDSGLSIMFNHQTGFLQIKGGETASSIRDAYYFFMGCLSGVETREVMARPKPGKSLFQLAGIRKSRGRPPKRLIEEARAILSLSAMP